MKNKQWIFTKIADELGTDCNKYICPYCGNIIAFQIDVDVEKWEKLCRCPHCGEVVKMDVKGSENSG